MQVLELAIWSASAGAITLVVLVSLGDWFLTRQTAALHALIYNVACLLFVLLLSGLAGALLPRAWAPQLRVAQVLIGPVCACLGDLWLRGFLGARYRDRLMDLILLVGGTSVPVICLVSVWLLPPASQLPLAAVLVIMNTVMVLWMTARAWMQGDPLALGLAAGSALMVSSTAGLYAIALGVPFTPAGHMAIAAAAALCIALIGFMLWQRNRRRLRVGVEGQSQFDPVTRLPSGVPLVRHLVRAQKRRRLTRREGAVIAVLVFEPERLRNIAGNAGLNEAYLHLAQRLQHQVGVMHPVGRYWDRCFIALMEAIHSPAALRTVGLRVATSLRRPMQVVGADGQPVQAKLDIGVGVLRLTRESEDVEDLLHDAQMLAEAARKMASRAATRDPRTGEIVAVEDAQLGPRRPRGRLAWRSLARGR
jgi:GGDEF domain-containing protein